LDAKCLVYMDEGSRWETDQKCCVLLASMLMYQPTVFLLVARKGTTRFYFKERICVVALERWHELDMIADIKFREVTAQLRKISSYLTQTVASG
jgi:hypothetical protein